MTANADLRRLAKTVSRQPEWILALAASLVVVWLHFYFLQHAGVSGGTKSTSSTCPAAIPGRDVEGFVSSADAAAGQWLDGHWAGSKRLNLRLLAL